MKTRYILILSLSFLMTFYVPSTVAYCSESKQNSKTVASTLLGSGASSVDTIILEDQASHQRLSTSEDSTVKKMMYLLNTSQLSKCQTTKKNITYRYQLRLKNGPKQLYMIKIGNCVSINGKAYAIAKLNLKEFTIQHTIDQLQAHLDQQNLDKANLYKTFIAQPPVVAISINATKLNPILGTYSWTQHLSGNIMQHRESDSVAPDQLLKTQTIIPTTQSNGFFTVSIDYPDATFQAFTWSTNGSSPCKTEGNKVFVSKNNEPGIYCIKISCKQGSAYYFFYCNVTD